MITSRFHTKNREKLQSELHNCLIVIPANGLMQSSADLHFPFRQDSNFWYLTGINEPDMVLLIDTVKNESVLLTPEQSDYKKEWEGESESQELTRVSGIDVFDSLDSLSQRLKTAKKKKRQ